MKLTKEQVQWLVKKEFMFSRCCQCANYDDCYLSTNEDYNYCFVISTETLEYINENMPDNETSE